MDLLTVVRYALEEDIGPGDVTTEATVDVDATGRAVILAKQDLVVCGHLAARTVFEELASRGRGGVTYEVVVPDGASALPRDVIARIAGPLRVLLTGERVALNLLMKLSGIATHVRAYVDAAGPTGPRVVDTRKTTPLLRSLEKMAVRCGGARNHRHALYDGVLIKDNHIAAAGGIPTAVRRAREQAHHLSKIEVEVGDIAQLDEALDAGADVVLLDNMDDAGLARCVARARGRSPHVLLEASGNMDPGRIARIRDLGLDLVSAGGLVHQARWADLSLDVVAT
jgi:nicotinate-nucleotide pyrophosphorylase (carboxylating)